MIRGAIAVDSCNACVTARKCELRSASSKRKRPDYGAACRNTCRTVFLCSDTLLIRLLQRRVGISAGARASGVCRYSANEGVAMSAQLRFTVVVAVVVSAFSSLAGCGQQSAQQTSQEVGALRSALSGQRTTRMRQHLLSLVTTAVRSGPGQRLSARRNSITCPRTLTRATMRTRVAKFRHR
jgi:hypothetical protein